MTHDRLPLIDVIVDSPLWTAQPDAEATVRRAVAACADEGSSRPGELAIVLTDDSAIRELNRNWRGRDAATNVLSFPAPPADWQGETPSLGDIVIAYETTAREATADGKAFVDHVTHLTVHGFLHLLGHDHEDDREADAMERLETKILSRLGVADPYAAREPEHSR